MKKIIIFVLLILSVGVFGADLHVTPFSQDAITYAKINNYNVILWFVDGSNATYKMRDEILLNGQLIAATEDVMWVVVDVTNKEGLDLAYYYGVSEFPTIISLDIDGKELYGSRFSYGVLNQNALIADTLLMSLVANSVIDWEVADNWYDDRYLYNQLTYVDYTYWNINPNYDYQSDFYNDNSVRRYYDNSYNSNNLSNSVTILYQIYPELPPISSNYYEINNRVIKVYINYSHHPHPKKIIHYNCPPRQLIFAGCGHYGKNNVIYTVYDFERERRPNKPLRIHTFSERMKNVPRNLTKEEKQKLNPLNIDYKRSPFYKKNLTHSFKPVGNDIVVKEKENKIYSTRERKNSREVIVKDKRPVNKQNNVNKPNPPQEPRNINKTNSQKQGTNKKGNHPKKNNKK